MKITPQLRILPVLIFVAIIAFAIRLVDFATGISALNSAAYAEESANKIQPQAGGPDESELSSPETEDIDHDAKDDGHAAEKEVADEREWRDPVYDDVEYSPATRAVFEDLTMRRQKLDRREKEIMTREALLRAAEQELDQKYQELSSLRVQIEDLLGRQSEEEAARIASLVKIYEGMKPKEAARIFDTLDLDVLMTVMSRMSERRLSPILANMNPERARTITILLAEEKQLPTLPGNN